MPINADKYRDTHLSSQLMTDYIEGTCSSSERHEVEKHLLNCEMCQDAMDGFESMDTSTLKTDLASIRKELAVLSTSKKNKYGGIFKIAASLSLLIVAVFLVSKFFFSALESENLALEEGKEELKEEEIQTPTKKRKDVASTESLLELEDAIIGEKESPLPKRKASIPEQPAMVAESKFSEVVAEDKAPLEAPESKQTLSNTLTKRQAGLSVSEQMEVTAQVDDLDTSVELEVEAVMDEELSEVVFEMISDQEPADMENDIVSNTSAVQGAARVRSLTFEPLSSVFGKVLSEEDSQGIPGVTVFVKGQPQIATVTDIDGDFKLDLPKDSSVLVYSFIGYEAKELVAIPGTPQDVQLQIDASPLSEVVVAGYATTRKSKRSKSINEDVVIAPEPIKGLNRYTKDLQKNLVYPQEAHDNGVEGIVVLKFQVGVDGEIINIEVVEGIGSGCDEEAMRLVSEGTNWVSGTVNQMPIEMEASFTVSFVISE